MSKWTVILLLIHAGEWAEAGLVLLRARPERPRRRGATDERDEIAPLHSITSSARASSDGGTSMPSAFAVVRLMTRSNLVGCSTGTSLGFALRKILANCCAICR